MQQYDLDARPLAEGLHELADQAADAPGLFDAVSAGARRRSARVRVSGAVLAVGGVLGVAAGVATWPLSGAPNVVTDASRATSIAPYRCPAEPPVYGRPFRTPGPSDRLFTGTPAAATLCVYKLTETATVVHPEQITGSEFKTLAHDLAQAKPGPLYCPEVVRDHPEHLLVLQYPDGSTQPLVIMSGCGTVGNGTWSALLPTELRKRLP